MFMYLLYSLELSSPGRLLGQSVKSGRGGGVHCGGGGVPCSHIFSDILDLIVDIKHKRSNGNTKYIKKSKTDDI